MSGIAADERLAILAAAWRAAIVDGRANADEGERLSALEARLGPLAGAARLAECPAEGPHVRHAARLLAWGAAIAACSADGLRSPDETVHLAELASRLGLSQPEIGAVAATADALATAALVGPGAGSSVHDGEALIVDAAIRAGALAGANDPMAALAVIALQLKLVHRLVAQPGAEGDRASCRRRVLAAGAGLVAQYLEALALALGLTPESSTGGASASTSRLSFATTFALGRSVTGTDDGDARFDARLSTGRTEFIRRAPAIDAARRTVDPRRLVAFVRES